MKILQVCGYAAPYPGNFIMALMELSLDCKKRGYETVFAFPKTAKEKEWCQQIEKEFKVYYLPLEKARIRIETYQKIKRIYEENDIKIVHSHFELYDMPSAIMKKANMKIFWHLHDSLDLIYSKSSFIYRCLWKFQYKYAGKGVRLLSVSEKAKEFAIQLGFNSENAYFFPNGIDTNRLKKNEEIKKKYDFLIFGWDFKRKGVDLILQATEKMEIKEYTIGVVMGEREWRAIDKKKYPMLIQQEPVDNIAELYHQTKCFLHVSRSEGLSYALLEALYSGIIVISSDIEQNLFAKQFKNAIFVKNENVDDISEKMEMVLRGKIEISREQIIETQKKIESTYSINEWKRRLQKLYFE